MKKLLCLLLAFVMVMAMAACGDENKKAYEEAVTAYNNGDYENAANQLAALGDYQDAASLLASITAEKAGVTMEITSQEGTASADVEYVFKDGNLIKETVTYADGTVVKNYYKYDEQGLCTSETLNQPDGGKVVINHLYDNGIQTRTIRTNADKTKDTFVYTCDENGKVLSHVLTLSDGIVEEAAYTYNEQGLLSEINGSTGITTYEYNAFGDVVSETLTANDETVCSTTYSYLYNFIVSK